MVNWNRILTGKNQRSVVKDFVEGTLNLKTFKSRLNVEARQEINKVSSFGALHCRTLARKALRRRNIRYSLVN